MTDTIQVELTKEVARKFADIPLGDGDPDTLVRVIRDKVAAALPPEYPEGTIAWVTRPFGDRCVAVWLDGQWRTGAGQPFYSTVTKVEPLRVLADDEIAVKRSKNDFAADYRAVARNARQGGFYMAAATADRYADALDAEKK